MSPRVLLIDDEQMILRAMGRGLERAGYQVDVASSGLAALDLIRQGGYEAILCDVHMPGLSGEELFRILESERPELIPRIVFATGNLHDPALCQFLDRCGRAAIGKPYSVSELLGVLDTTLAQSQQAS